MTREFPDELRNNDFLSAFLDNELPPAERAQVEQHLAASAADRQLLAELQSLRSDVAALPPVTVKADFADRVVRAALAEAEKHNAAATTTTLPPPVQGRLSLQGSSSLQGREARRWMVGAAVASAAALAACFLLVVQPWRHDTPQPGVIAVNPSLPETTINQIAVASNQFLDSLRGALPAEGEAVVLRLRVNKDVPLAAAIDAALVKAGIASLAMNTPTGAPGLSLAYKKALEATYGPIENGAENKALLDATVAAAQAVFLEAPLERLEGILTDLSAGMKQPLALHAEGKIAYRVPERAEGEPGSANPLAQIPAAGQAFAQKLNASWFRLEKTLTDAANAAVAPQQPAPAMVSPQQLVRVLILVETE